MKKIKVLSVFGTRPEAIKMAPLVKHLAALPEFESLCCLTGQHREMLDSVMDIFRLKGDFDLNIMQTRQTLSSITSRTILGMDEVLDTAQPDLILVHGDTSTTFAGALSAFYHKIPVGHVEAGLRTWDKYSPFPEEMNRTLVGDIAELHFCPTANNLRNLEREAVRELALAHPEIEVVYPVHLSPVVRECAFGILKDLPRVHLIDPIDVENMHNLMARCFLVMTDSGGLQEEAPALGKTVLVLRRETERPEAVGAGTVKLAGVKKADILALAEELLTDKAAYDAMARAVNPYGDGNACGRIAQGILWHFGRIAEKPADFGAEN